MKKLGIYIHIPFCLSKCRYCGFYSRGDASKSEQEDYLKSLIGDIREYGRVYGRNSDRGKPFGNGEAYEVDTIFIGGGTPSILPSSYISTILDEVRRAFFVDEDAEISLESNPATLDKDKLLAYRRAGVNRLSIGLQSFDSGCLKALGRAHTVSDFMENFKEARAAGFDNINVDLMFAIPGHTMEIWEDTLRRVIDISPEHISFYSLQIEEGTPFYEMYRRGEFDEISDELDREMYHRAIEILRGAGYEHYEISNCALPGRACRHNLKYWSMEDYLGIGSAASSFMEGVRFTEAPLTEFHENTFEDNVSEFVFTGLRKTSGIVLHEFKARFGREFWNVFADCRKELEPFFECGQLVEENGVLRLTEEGFDISNTIMAVFV